MQKTFNDPQLYLINQSSQRIIVNCARVFDSHFCTHKAKIVTIQYVSLYNIAITSEIDRKTLAVRIHYPENQRVDRCPFISLHA